MPPDGPIGPDDCSDAVSRIKVHLTFRPVCRRLLQCGWSRALRGLDHHHIVVMAGVPLQALAPHGDLVAHEFIYELERVQPVAWTARAAQSDHHASTTLLL